MNLTGAASRVVEGVKPAGATALQSPSMTSKKKSRSGEAIPTVLFAGGGTGGHLSPGLAMAEAVNRRNAEELQRVAEATPSTGAPTKTAPAHLLRCFFACSDRAIDAQMLEEARVSFIATAARPFGMRPGPFAQFVRGWMKSKRQARRLIARENVRLVVALGGFVASPVIAAAKRARIHTILLNLDAVPGKANRLIARSCNEVLSVCPTPGFAGFDRRHVPMPLRMRALAATFGDRAECRRRLELDPDRSTLVVTGASQGSRSLNDLMRALARKHRDLLDGWQVYHISGKGREEDLARTYERAKIPARVVAFEENMGLAWGAADLAISRAGASSVAEIAANAVPAVFFPYPFHRDRHQWLNAQPLANCAGAVILADHIRAGANLHLHLEELQPLFRDEGKRAAMRLALAKQAPPNGADEMAELILDRLRGRV